MDTRIVEVRKNITISRYINNENSFSANIKIDFIPDVVIVKHIIFIFLNPNDTNTYLTSIYTDLVSDYIGTFTGSSAGNSSLSSITYTLNKPINSLYTFKLLSPFSNVNDNEMIIATRHGDLVIHLEFVKYKEEKQSKIY